MPASLVYLNPDHIALWHLLLWNYGGVILSFIGALHWAFAMLAKELSERDQTLSYIWSVIPALVAWVAMSFDDTGITPWVLAFGFIAQFIQDFRLSRKIALPSWFIPLRLQLSTVAFISLCLS